MVTAQVKPIAVSSQAPAKNVGSGIKADTSFADMFKSENNVSENKTGRAAREEDVFAVSSKTVRNEPEVRTSASREDGEDKAVSGQTAGESPVVKEQSTAKEMPAETVETEEVQNEKAEALMGIIAGLITEISAKTGIDEAAVKEFISTNNLTSENLLDIHSWKGLVTEANQLDSISAILTNDKAFKDLGEISAILEDLLGSSEMGQLTAGLIEGVTDEKVGISKEVLGKADELLAEFVGAEVVADNEALAASKNAEADTAWETEMNAVKEAYTVQAAGNTETADTKSGFEQGNFTKGQNVNTAGKEAAVSHQLFDNLASNLQKLENADILPEGTTAKSILNQVANEISNLRAPDRTSLEFLLTPAALGKVAVNVSIKNGIMQAEFRVTNPEAKAALESQIADLKLNFENQGLKVSEVSVMLSETGIGSDSQRRNAEGDGSKKGGRGNRRFSLDGEETAETVSVSPEEAMRAYTDGDTGSNVNFSA